MLLDERAASLKSYEDFLALWHDADADLPVYQQRMAKNIIFSSSPVGLPHGC